MVEEQRNGSSLLIGIGVLTLLLAILVGRLIISIDRSLIGGDGHGLSGTGAFSTLPILLLSGFLIVLILMMMRTVSSEKAALMPVKKRDVVRTTIVVVISFFFGIVIQPLLRFEIPLAQLRLVGGLIFLIPLLLITLLLVTHIRSDR